MLEQYVKNEIRIILKYVVYFEVVIDLIGDGDDFYEVGFFLFDMIQLMFVIEKQFNIEIFDEMLNCNLFCSIDVFVDMIVML